MNKIKTPKGWYKLRTGITVKARDKEHTGQGFVTLSKICASFGPVKAHEYIVRKKKVSK